METTDTDPQTPGAVPTFGDDVRAALQSARRVVVATDDSDEALASTRAVALHLAREFELEVVLYDRSDERWTDTPHPSGPFTADEIDSDRRPHLPRQLRDFAAGGVTATAWLATVPALTALIDVLQDLDIDGVLLPAHLDKPKMMDRIQVGSDTASMVERVAELQLPNPPIVFTVTDGTTVERATYSEGD